MKEIVASLVVALLLLGCGDRSEKQNTEKNPHDSGRTETGDSVRNVDTAPSRADESSGVDPEDLLIGLWQDAPSMAAGWSATYQFFPDGTFVLNENQMDCAKRLVWSKGKWRRVGEEELELTVNEWFRLEGGRMVPSDGSCASDSMLIGAKENRIRLEEPKALTLPLGPIIFAGDDHPERTTVTIGDVKFYRFGDDPSAYP